MKLSTKGFSLMEIMVVIAIFILITCISTCVFQNTNKKQSLDKAVTNTVSLINSVRSLAVSSVGFCSYGVNIGIVSNSITSFAVSDSSCIPGNFASTSLSLDSFGVIISTSTIGDGSIIFQKVKGDTIGNNSFQLQLRDDSSSSKIITIYSTGLLEVN